MFGTWMTILLTMSIIVILMVINKRFDKSPYYEGFVQNERFVSKRDQDIYDDFYVVIYDQLNKTDKRTDFDIKQIIDMTQPDKQHSAFLDVGSGTGHTVNALHKLGYNAIGIEKSQSMCKYCQNAFPQIQLQTGDVLDPMSFDRGVFTHILCSYFTIYQFQDKIAFFRNCHYWLRSGGYLILHLVDRDEFDPIIPCGKPALLDDPQKYSAKRITDTIINFPDFKYRASFDFSKKQENKVIFTEKFTDELSQNVRQNEQVLYMEPIDKILYTAQFCGFIPHGKVDYSGYGSGDKNQYIYVLERGN
jgi:SAM-dependent methyltransferase